MLTALLSLGTVAVTSTLATPAFADARTEARAHFKRGMEAITAGKYEEGIAELQKAYQLSPHPNVLYNIGRAYAEQGELEKAVDNFKRYIAENPPDKDEVQSVVNSLEARLKRQQQAAREAAQGQPTTPTTPTAPEKPTPQTPTDKLPETPEASKTDLGKARTEDVFDETIVTTSKGSQAQSPLDAANSTSIITEQDIRLTGITKIPELLRRLAGVDIMQVTGGQTEVSIRGFNQRLSNKVLVLVDGRSVYVDILGATIWQTLSIGVEDIARIEVVRGPASALYGADAFNGVINIITKKPGEGKNGLAGGYGDQAMTHGSLWASGRDGDFAYRLAAGYDYLPRWSREVPNGRADVRTGVGDQVESSRTIRLDARGTQKLGKGVTLGFGGGLAQGSLEILGVGTLNDIALPSFAATDVTTFINSEHVDARVFWNRLRAESTLNVNYLGQSLSPSHIEQNILDGEVVYKGNFAIGGSVTNQLRLGAAYRYKDVVWTYLDQPRVEHHYALFLHDELKLSKAISLVGDYRVDWVPYLERFQQSPRGAVLIHPSPKSTIRGSIATAFRKPTFLESYLRIPLQLPIAGAGQFSEGVRRDDPGFIVNAERLLSAEVGYMNQSSDVFSFDTALYFNRITSLIQLARNRPLSVADLGGAGVQDPATGLYPIGFGGFENQCQTYNLYGGEAGVRVYPTEGLDFYGNYTLNVMQQDNSNCSAFEVSRIVSDQRTPRHKVNAGVQLRTKAGVDGSIDFHYVGSTVWAEQVTNLAAQQIEQQEFSLSQYTLLNARLGYRFLGDKAEVAATAFNIVDLKHRQHPFGQLLGRRTMLLFTYRF